MHISPCDGVHLIERHFVPWGTYFSELPQIINTAQETLRFQKKKMDTLEQARCDQVVNQATERQLDVLRAFAKGLSPQEVANHLCLSIKTIDTYKTGILALCRNAWNKEPNESLDYHFLQKAFADYFDSDK